MSILLSAVMLLNLSSCTSSGDSNQAGEEASSSGADQPALSSEEAAGSMPETTEMVCFEGGSFMMGNDQGKPDQQPEHEQQVKSFYMDKHPVTVAEFRVFIEETGYTTDADSFGNAGVFLFNRGRWDLVDQANWQYPMGPSGPKAKGDHPVTQVSWRDARAYCRWAGKHLPKEKQWEYAATNGGEIQAPYPWGSDNVVAGGHYKANVWQGSLQEQKVEDGFKFTSPVGYYGEHPGGLTDMAGNVWEWCRDVYHPYPGSHAGVRENPKVRVIRGGSFFFDQAGTDSYTVSYRSKNTTETSLFNLGFRCAYTPDD